MYSSGGIMRSRRLCDMFSRRYIPPASRVATSLPLARRDFAPLGHLVSRRYIPPLARRDFAPLGFLGVLTCDPRWLGAGF